MSDKLKIKIDFINFWSGFDKLNNYFYKLLSEKYTVEINENPDVLFFSVFGEDHLKYKCTKVFYTGENIRPDFLLCDFAFSFDYSVNRRNYRLPLYALYGDMNELVNRHVDASKIIAEKKKFCCFIVSNGGCKLRNDFFYALSKYKTVDSGGEFLNNIGGPVTNKLDFIKDYKFVISFENASYPGYTTEKIYEPLTRNCIPIYWGDPLVHQDFNPQAFINSGDYSSFEEVIKHVIEVDNDNDAYARYISAPAFNNDEINQYAIKEHVVAHLDKIIFFHFNNKLKLRAQIQAPAMFLRTHWHTLIYKIKRVREIIFRIL